MNKNFCFAKSDSARFKRICHIHPNGRDYLKAVGGARKPQLKGFRWTMWSEVSEADGVLWDDFFGCGGGGNPACIFGCGDFQLVFF